MLSPMSATLPEPGERPAQPDGITILGVQFASIRNLFAPLTARADLMFVHVNDWLAELRSAVRPQAFVKVKPLAGADWREWRFPPGWANRLAPWIMPHVAERLERAWREREWRNPRLVITFPYFLPLVRRLGPKRTVYYAVDNYQAYWPDRSVALGAQENELIRTAAATVAASSTLATWFRTRVPSAATRVHHLPNGVAPEMICTPEAAEGGASVLDVGLAQRFGNARGPVVGCYGNTAPGYGLDFLAAIAARLPDFRFLLMGQMLSDDRAAHARALAKLARSPNVVMLGHVPEPHSLRFLRQCHIMIIPLPLTEQIRYSCPNRLWTYMATGRPIVSTPIAEVIRFGELVYPAASVDEFVDALRRVAQEDDVRLALRRLAIAKEHAWPRLARRMWSILSSTS